VRGKPIVIVDKDDERVGRHLSRQRQCTKGSIADDLGVFDAGEGLLRDFFNPKTKLAVVDGPPAFQTAMNSMTSISGKFCGAQNAREDSGSKDNQSGLWRTTIKLEPHRLSERAKPERRKSRILFTAFGWSNPRERYCSG